MCLINLDGKIKSQENKEDKKYIYFGFASFSCLNTSIDAGSKYLSTRYCKD